MKRPTERAASTRGGSPTKPASSRPKPRATTAPRERVRTGGRSARVRETVGRACLDLLAQGIIDFGHRDVAEASGVSRATIYRWWPTQDDLLREALALHTSRVTTPNTGAWESDLRALADELATFFSDPIEVAINIVVTTGKYRELDEVVVRHYRPAVDQWCDVVYRAIARKEVHPDTSPDVVVRMLTSALLIAPLLLHRRATDDEVREVADFVLAATGRSAEADRNGRARKGAGTTTSRSKRG